MLGLSPLTLLALVLAAAGVGIFVRDVRSFRARSTVARTDLERLVLRLERWKYGSAGAAVLLGLVAAEATMRSAPRGITLPLYVLVALAVSVGAVASIVSGWRQGRR